MATKAWKITQHAELEFEYQGSYRLEKYLNIQNCLQKSFKNEFALKST